MWIPLLLLLILPATHSCNITTHNDNQMERLVQRTSKCLSYAVSVVTLNSTEISVAIPSPGDDVPLAVESLVLDTLKILYRSAKTSVSTVHYNNASANISKSRIKHLLVFVSRLVDVPNVVNSYCNGVSSKSVVIVLPPKEKFPQVDFKTLNFTKMKTIFFAAPTHDYLRPLVIFILRDKTKLVDINFNCELFKENPRAVSTHMLHLAVNRPVTIGFRFIPPYIYEKSFLVKLNLKFKPIYYGTELALLRAIGLDIKYFENHEVGECTSNGTCVGLLGDVQNDKVDVIAGGLGIYLVSCSKYGITFSYPLFHDKVVVVVKNKLRNTISDGSQTRILQKEVWIVYSIVLVISVGLSYWIERRLHSSTSRYSLSDISLSWFGVSLGMPTESYEGFVSLLLVPSLWISFIVRIVYQIHLLTMLLQRNVPSTVHHLEDICRDNYTLFTATLIDDFTRGPLEQCSREMFILCKNPLACLNDSSVTDGKKYAAITYLNTYKYELYKYLTPEQDNVFHVVDQVVVEIPISYVLKCGDPTMDYIHKIGNRIFATGFVAYINALSDRLSIKHLMNVKGEFGLDVNFTPLSLKHVKFIFILHIFGVSLSVACFFLELLWYRINGKKGRNLQ